MLPIPLPLFMLASVAPLPTELGSNTGLHREISPVLCDHLEGWDWEGGARGRGYGDICILIPDSLCHTAETNTTL